MRASLFTGFLVFVCLAATQGYSAQKLPQEFQGVGIEDRLGQQVSIQDITLRNENGEPVRLAQYFHSGRPVLLNLVYFECPSLCSYVLNGLVDSLKPMQWVPGNQFDILTVSIDPKETSKLAAAKREAYLKAFGKPGAEQGWHFLTGDEAQVKRLASEVGFNYKWDEATQQYAHGAGVFILTPQGKVSRVLYGIFHKERDLKLALVEASGGKIGSIVDRIVLFCFHYDPQSRSYSPYVMRLMQAAALGTVLVFGSYLAWFWRRQRKGALSPC